MCNRWQASTGEWCRLAPDDIVALRALTPITDMLSSPMAKAVLAGITAMVVKLTTAYAQFRGCKMAERCVANASTARWCAC